MWLLTLLLSAALATISVIGVGARPGRTFREALENPYGPPWYEKTTCRESFDKEAIEKALIMDTIDETTQFYEVFIKILTGVKKELPGHDAQTFIQKLCDLAADETHFWPYLKIFKLVVVVYVTIHKTQEPEDLSERIYTNFDGALKTFTGHSGHFTAQNISPMLAELIITETNSANIIEEIVTNLLEDSKITVEIGKYFHGSEKINEPAYAYVMDALKFA